MEMTTRRHVRLGINWLPLALGLVVGWPGYAEEGPPREWSADDATRIPTWSDPSLAAPVAAHAYQARPQRVAPLAENSRATIHAVTAATSLGTARSPDTGVVPAGHLTVVPAMFASQTRSSCDSCGGGCALGHHGAPPLGASLDYYFGRQIANGNRARQVLYHFDFGSARGDASRLNVYGVRKLRRLISLMDATGSPIIVESTPDRPALAAARRSHVLDVLQTQLGVPVSDAQVVVGLPPEPGLRADEAAEIYIRHMATTRAQGTSTSGFQSGLTNNLSTGIGNRR